eukprot:scaffold290231_cov38-Prasinocladus_malaysianus.AAC.1
MPGLFVLQAENNMLTGTVPEAFGKLSNIQLVTLQGNYLTGSHPFREDVDVTFGPQNTLPSDIADSDICVFENTNWAMSLRPGSAYPGYYAEYTGLVDCFINCPDADVVVWDEDVGDCQCWSTSDGFFMYPGPGSMKTAYVIAFCTDPDSGSALSLAPTVPEFIGAQTRTAAVPVFERSAFIEELLTFMSPSS